MKYLIKEKGMEKGGLFVDHPCIPYVKNYHCSPNKYRVRIAITKSIKMCGCVGAFVNRDVRSVKRIER